MAEVKVINVYGIDPNWKPPTKKQWHGTSYLEWEVPAKLYKKLNRMIEKEIKEFRKSCPCDECKTKAE